MLKALVLLTIHLVLLATRERLERGKPARRHIISG
jgi:hypothetical protein